jgi:hypothetical protein
LIFRPTSTIPVHGCKRVFSLQVGNLLYIDIFKLAAPILAYISLGPALLRRWYL